MSVTKLLTDSITTDTGALIPVNAGKRTFQANVAGTGAVTATVVIEVSNDGTNVVTLGTIGLSGTTSAVDGFASDAAWAFARARISAISGTGATVNVFMGA